MPATNQTQKSQPRLVQAAVASPRGDREPARSNRSPGRDRADSAANAFTLIELLAVVVVVLLLAGLILGGATYLERQAKYAHTKSLMAVIDNACESYRMDVGRYPTSTVYRLTVKPVAYWEYHNAGLLYNQLTTNGSKYLRVSQTMTGLVAALQWDAPSCLNSGSPTSQGWQTKGGEPQMVIMDPWGQPFSYYCTYPVVTTGITSNRDAGSCTYTSWTNYPPVYFPYTSRWTNSATIGPQINTQGYDLWSFGPNSMNDTGTVDDIANFRIGRQAE